MTAPEEPQVTQVTQVTESFTIVDNHPESKAFLEEEKASTPSLDEKIEQISRKTCLTYLTKAISMAIELCTCIKARLEALEEKYKVE